MRSRPPKKLSPEKEKAAAAFINAAEEDEPEVSNDTASDRKKQTPDRGERRRRDPQPPQVYPWEEPYVREDVNQAFSIRMPEPLYLKLKYISEQTGRSMNHMLTTLAKEMVEERLDEVL